jgi:hypothetical protein
LCRIARLSGVKICHGDPRALARAGTGDVRACTGLSCEAHGIRLERGELTVQIGPAQHLQVHDAHVVTRPRRGPGYLLHTERL